MELCCSSTQFFNEPSFPEDSQSGHLQNCFLKKFIFKIPQKMHFKHFLKNTLKCIFKNTFSENTFSNCSHKKYIFKIAPSKKYTFKNAFSRNIFLKLLHQKIYFRDYFL